MKSVEETPFIDALEEEDESLDEVDNIASQFHFSKNGSRWRRYVKWSVFVVVTILVLSAVFCVGIVVGHFTASSGGTCTNSAVTSPVTTPPPTGGDTTPVTTPPPTDTTPNTNCTCTTPNNTVRDEICENPPVLLISLDGFWNGYFKRNVTPTISLLGREGVQAEYVRSAFPTKTFPNHYTIVTGLYPESHGIVDNYFYDKMLKDSFSLGDTDPKWWLGEPVWVTADKQGLRSGTYFWPGSDVLIEGMHPTYYVPYDSSVPYEERLQRILEWLNLPSPLRPQFLTLYLNEPDHSGHLGGPDSALVDAALGRVDEVIEDLLVELKEKDIYDCVNIVIVSDHGMTTFNSSKLFHIQDHIPQGYEVSYSNYGVNMNINVNDGDNESVQAVYEAIQNISDTPFQTFHLEDVPLRLHVGHHNQQRFGDIFLVGDLGSYITYKNSRVPLGEHGYDNNEVDMQAIFLAHGPAFKEGYLAPAFDNIQIYNLLCALLNITPSANNGTFGALHHMLKPAVADALPPVVARDGVEGVVLECQLSGDTSQPCETCFCSDSCQASLQNLISDPDEVRMYQDLHLPLGVPRGGEGLGACLLTNNHSVTLYSTYLHIPLWVAFTLSVKSSVSADGAAQCYIRDPRTPPVQCGNYSTSQSDYVLTHFTPHINGMYLPLISNAVPQLSIVYDSVWSEWEQQLMEWTVMYGTIHVILGTVLDSDRDGLRDEDHNYNQWLNGNGSVAIPSGFYSIVTRCVEVRNYGASCPVSSVDVLGVLLPHQPPSSHVSDIREFLQFRLTTVWDIESITDINFFPELSAEQQARLKLHITSELWM